MIVLLDVHGVIADFESAFLKVAQEVTGREVERDDEVWDLQLACEMTHEEKATVWDRVYLPGFADTLEPLHLAVEGVRSLAEISTVYFVTSPVPDGRIEGAPTWSSDCARWLNRHFGSDLGGNVIHTRHKHRIHGHVFVDDKPQAVKDWQATWHKGVGIEWPYPEADYWEVVREAALRVGGTHV